MFDIQQKILNEMNINKPSIFKIASDAKLARATVYNNPLLKEYIEIRIAQFNTNDLYNQIDRQSSRISDLETKVAKMKERDVKEELLNYKIQVLQDEVILRRKQNEELQEKYNNASKRINELEMPSIKKHWVKQLI